MTGSLLVASSLRLLLQEKKKNLTKAPKLYLEASILQSLRTTQTAFSFLYL